MKLTTHVILLIALHLVAAKQFEECEFAIELYNRHQVPREDIYKHFCIASSLHTARESIYGYNGIYAISKQWWCGKDAPGGGCNVTCSDLLDDDIADDVSCANLILSQQGLGGWGTSEKICKRYAVKVDDCLDTVDVLIALTGNNVSEIWTTSTTTTTSTSVAPTTAMPVISPTTTEEFIYLLTTPTSTGEPIDLIPSPSTTAAELSENDYGADVQSSQHQTLNTPVECSCKIQNILLSIMVAALLVATVIVLLKYRNLKRFVSSVNDKEYEEHLI